MEDRAQNAPSHTIMQPGSDEIRVLAAVIERDGRYLVCKRPAHKRHGSLWEFPGGKLEAGESLADAAQRELHEELGVEITSIGNLLMSIHDEGSVFTIDFVEVAIRGEPAAIEHETIVWAQISEIEHLPLAPSDARFVRGHLLK